MALLLLKADTGSTVSLELFDDVAVETKSGDIVATQMKSGVRKNPVSDKSVELWKTFANWTRQVRSGELDPSRTVFELFVRKNFSGAIVRSFAQARYTESSLQALKAARDELWGSAPRLLKKPHVAADLQPHLEEIFGSSAGMRACRTIIERFQFTASKLSPTDGLHDYVANHLAISPAVVIPAVCYFEGWVKQETDRQIAATGRAPAISRDRAWQEFTTFVHSISSGGNLPDVGEKPGATDLGTLLGLPFVRQLDLIRLEPESRQHAMIAYFRAASARTRWVDSELLREESLTELEDTLSQTHRDLQTKTYATSHAEDLQGRLLLGECNRYRCKVEGKDTPEYFLPGCFHSMANRLLLGWHPRFLELMKSVA